MAKKKETGPYAKRGLYEISGETIKRRANLCPRCGPGVFMATHSDNKPRESCGRCGYTEYKR